MPFAYQSPFAFTVFHLQDWRWTFKGSKSSLSQVSGNLAHIWSIPLKDWNSLCSLAIWDNDFPHGGSNTIDGLSSLSCRFRWRIQIWLLRFGWESQRTRWSFGLAGQGSGFQSWEEGIWGSLDDGIRFPGFLSKKPDLTEPDQFGLNQFSIRFG